MTPPNEKNNINLEAEDEVAAEASATDGEKNDATPPKKQGRFSKRDVALMIVSVFFAFLVWSYVLNAENPYREKTVRNVSVTFTGESALNNNQKLMVIGNRDEILSDVNVVISVPARLYSDMTANRITVTADLSGVTEAGEAQLPLSARINGSSDVSVVSVSPSTIKVQVDDIRERRLPVEIVYKGEIADGYHAFEPVLDPSSITLIGAATELASVAKAVCEVDMTGRMTSVHDSFPVTLYDASGAEVDFDSFSGDMPYTTCKMTVLAKKTVPIDISSSIVGLGSLTDGYELKSVPSVSPTSTVEIAAEQSVLDAISAIQIETISVAGTSESVLYSDVKLLLPDGVRLTSDESYSIFVDIGEKQSTKTYYDIPIEIRNISGEVDTELSVTEGKAVVAGAKSAVDSLRKSGVTLFVDAFGLGVGVHEMTVYVELDEGFETLEAAAVPQSLTLTITQTE